MTTATKPAPRPSPALPDLPYDLFDCVQVNLAILADRWHGAGTALRLGADIGFQPAPGPDGLPTVERSAAVQLAHAGAVGLSVANLRHDVAAQEVRPGDGRYVVADAHRLPWVPYFEQRHMEHSFLVEDSGPDEVRVTDGYFNETRWGSARPGQWTLRAEAFATAVPTAALVADLRPAPEAPAPAPAVTTRPDPDLVAAFTDAYARHPDRPGALERLSLETWLLARARKLHVAFLAHTGALPDAAAATARLKEWDSLTEQVYMAQRRVERGRPEPRGLPGRLAELLRTDADTFTGSPAGTLDPGVTGAPAADSEALRRTVAAVAADVLDVPAQELLAGRALSDTPRFSSFRIVEIVERLEQELGVEFGPDDLVPENLHHVGTLSRVLVRALDHGARMPSVHPWEAR